MTISNSEPNLSFVVSTLQQLEAEQNTWKQNTIWLKRYFDELKQEFKTRPEVGEVEKMQEVILQLTAQVYDLQERFNQLPLLSNNSHSINTTAIDVLQEEEKIDSEIKEEFIESLDEQIKQVVLVEDFAKNEDNQNLENVEEQEEFDRKFNDFEFKLERMMWLLNRVYTADILSQNISISMVVEDFLKDYSKGQRDFSGINISGIDLSGKEFVYDLNSKGANLSNAMLCKINMGVSILVSVSI